MTYSNAQTEQLAWNNFVADSKMSEKYTDHQMTDVQEALLGYRKHQPSPAKVQGWVDQFGHEECVPSQLWRDGMIVDYLIVRKGYSLREATNIWCDWEDFEYELLELQTI